MRFRAWATFILLLVIVCRALVNTTPPVRKYPQALPPTMITGLLGVIRPNYISE